MESEEEEEYGNSGEVCPVCLEAALTSLYEDLDKKEPFYRPEGRN